MGFNEEEKMIQIAQVCAGRPGRTGNLTPAKTDVNDVGDKGRAYPLHIGCFSVQGKAGCGCE